MGANGININMIKYIRKVDHFYEPVSNNDLTVGAAEVSKGQGLESVLYLSWYQLFAALHLPQSFYHCFSVLMPTFHSLSKHCQLFH